MHKKGKLKVDNSFGTIEVPSAVQKERTRHEATEKVKMTACLNPRASHATYGKL